MANKKTSKNNKYNKNNRNYKNNKINNKIENLVVKNNTTTSFKPSKIKMVSNEEIEKMKEKILKNYESANGKISYSEFSETIKNYYSSMDSDVLHSRLFELIKICKRYEFDKFDYMVTDVIIQILDERKKNITVNK